MTPDERKAALAQLKTLRGEMRKAMKEKKTDEVKAKFVERKAVFATLKAARNTK